MAIVCKKNVFFMVFAQEDVTKEESEIRKQGWTTYIADFKAFNLAISPRLEALLLSGERLAVLTDSPLLPSQLSLQLVTLSSQATRTFKMYPLLGH